MKSFLFSTAILFSTMLPSCLESSIHDKKGMLQFEWKMAGHLPSNLDGSPSAGLAGAVVGISNDVLLVGGGSNFSGKLPWEGGKKQFYKEVFAFKREGDRLVLVKRGLVLPYSLAYSANCTTGKGIVVAGGENENGTTNKVLLLNWNESSQNIQIGSLPDLPQSLSAGAVAVDGNIIYFAGGQNASGASNLLYKLNLDDASKGWQVLPSLKKPVAYSVLYVQSNGKDKCLYLVGGRKMNIDSTSDLYNDVYQFNLKTNQWSQKASLPYALSAHTGLAFGENTLLVFSGDQGKTFHKTEDLLMQISKGKNATAKQLLIAEKNKLQENHPGFSHEVLAYNTVSDTWKAIDSIPFVGQVTTTALLWGNEVVIPCGEIRAGVRSADIIMGAIKSQ